MEENTFENSITLEELQQLLDNYFYSKEENDNKINSFLEEYKNIKNSNNELIEVNSSSEIDMHNELIQEIKTLQEYTKFSNNLFYFSIVIICLVFVYVLFYKFLRNFI